MGKTRETVCMFYLYEGGCKKNRDAEFYGICQTCPYYQPKPGARPNRTDTRRQRKERAARKEGY